MTVIAASAPQVHQLKGGSINQRSLIEPVGGRTLLIVLFCALGLRLLAMLLVPLLPEEAYYWMYAQHPALSYFDHPPMVAWVIRIGTLIFGDSEFGVRIMGNLMMGAASFAMYQLGRIWFARRTGLFSAVALQALPAYFATGFIATMDAPLLLFWLLCLLGLTIALKLEHPIGWYLAGVALGGAMLSKYTAVLLGLGAVIAVFGCRPWRRQLLTIHPYLSAAISIGLFSPVIIWNQQHGWASFRYQLIQRFPDAAFSYRSVLGFIAWQFVVASPLLLLAMVWLFWRLARSRRRLLTPRWWFAVCFSAPLLAVMAYKSLKYSINMNWTLPAYLSLQPATVHVIRAWSRCRSFRPAVPNWMPGLIWSGYACLGLCVFGCLYLLLLQPRLRFPAGFGPWGEVSGIVEDSYQRLQAQSGAPPMVIARGRYRLASILAFYCPSLKHAEPAGRFVTSQWFITGEGLNYKYWDDPDRWIGRDCLFVNDNGDPIEHTQGRFESVELIDHPRVPHNSSLQLAIGRKYRGPKPAPAR